jgi:hypothetical protein
MSVRIFRHLDRQPARLGLVAAAFAGSMLGVRCATDWG